VPVPSASDNDGRTALVWQYGETTMWEKAFVDCIVYSGGSGGRRVLRVDGCSWDGEKNMSALTTERANSSCRAVNHSLFISVFLVGTCYAD